MKTPAWLIVAGAVLAAVIVTSIPGLASAIALLESPHASSQMIVVEIPTALVMLAFGAIQMRAQIAGSGRWVGALIVLANVPVALASVFFLIAKTVTSTTEGGPVLILGTLGALSAAIVQSIAALFAWGVIAMLAREVKKRITGHDGEARSRRVVASVLVAAAIVHIVIKSATHGSIAFGAIAAVDACVVALGARGLAGGFAIVVVAPIVAIVGIVVQTRACVAHEKLDALMNMPRCTVGGDAADALGKRARNVAGVADAVAAMADDGRVTLYVLPVSGDLAPSTRDAVANSISSTTCAIDTNQGTKTIRASDVVIAPATSVPLDVTIHIHPLDAMTNADTPDLDRQARDALARAFDHHTPSDRFIHVPSRNPIDPSFGSEKAWASYETKHLPIQTAIDAMPPGSFATIRNVDVVVEAKR